MTEAFKNSIEETPAYLIRPPIDIIFFVASVRRYWP